MKVLKILGAVLGVSFLGVGLLFVLARFHDGPLAMIPGGPLEAGELVSQPIGDWGFASEVEEIELQLAGDETSRTTWILVSEGRAYIPCSLSFPPGKNWYRRADENGAALIRIQGKRYPVTLTRVTRPGIEKELGPIVERKYGRVPSGDEGGWFFELASREI
ncbi:MAG TPA: hypothetical protein ENI85_09890 [Deltaproteobacteria bacterium]|nr:hypothetical protein [Deltaproteobacteria bacterium]